MAARCLLLMALAWLGGTASALADDLPSPPSQQRLLIAPHATDERLAEADAPHLVLYERAADSASAPPPPPLLIWLPGTHGRPTGGPQRFFETALQQGYRLLALSYPTEQAVSQVCTAARLRVQPRCAEQVRQQRVWGEPLSGLIPDRGEDAIVPRLSQLLRYLAQHDPAGQWAQYLDGPEPRWERLVLSGQSQGGGMAAFLAQSRRVAGVLVFSGGWDHGPDGRIAAWYGRPSATPLPRWQATYHVEEPMAATMAQIYRRLGLPDDHVHALSLPVRGRAAHGEAIGNPDYLPLWRELLQRQP